MVDGRLALDGMMAVGGFFCIMMNALFLLLLNLYSIIIS